MTACSGSGPTPSDDRAGRSQAVVDAVVGIRKVPGCSAAVGRNGSVVWRGVCGLAILEPESVITSDTTFDIGSVSKQFTALAVALLADHGRLSLNDPVSVHLDGYPGWADHVTVRHLIHHTSGVPTFDNLGAAAGITPQSESSFDDLLALVAKEAATLNFRPGSRWEYSNSNYLLLAAIAEQVTGQPFGDHLQQTFFAPLDLTMQLGPPLRDPQRTRSYRADLNGKFKIIDVNGDARGPTGIRATPTDLVTWADNYRTGLVGGPLVTAPETGAVEGAREKSSYGLGIYIAQNGVLWHDGDVGEFHTAFVVSADRTGAIAVACNSAGGDPWKILEALTPIWEPG